MFLIFSFSRLALPCKQDKCDASSEDLCTNVICGLNAECRIINQNATCECIKGCVGDPFDECILNETSTGNPSTEKQLKDSITDESLTETPLFSTEESSTETQMRAEVKCCNLTSECELDERCIDQKCVDPCSKSCGLNADCSVELHMPVCSCPSGYSGDPFVECILIRKSSTESLTTERLTTTEISSTEKSTTEELTTMKLSTDKPSTEKQPIDPCAALSCGSNAICLERNKNATCECKPGYNGNPNKGCTLEDTACK